jgi:hypothetical protein
MICSRGIRGQRNLLSQLLGWELMITRLGNRAATKFTGSLKTLRMLLGSLGFSCAYANNAGRGRYRNFGSLKQIWDRALA